MLMVRIAILFIIILLLVFTIPALRRGVIEMIGQRRFVEFKNALLLALLIYFIFSVFWTIYSRL